MPGEIVSFAASDDARRLVSALRGLSAEGSTEFVLVGGLAVASRLDTFHRATQDLDALTGDDRHHFSELAIDVIAGAAMRDADLFVDGVRVDIIDIDPRARYSAIAELENPLDRLFNAAHLFAHTDASALTLASDGVDATVRVASARSAPRPSQTSVRRPRHLPPGKPTRRRPSTRACRPRDSRGRAIDRCLGTPTHSGDADGDDPSPRVSRYPSDDGRGPGARESDARRSRGMKRGVQPPRQRHRHHPTRPVTPRARHQPRRHNHHSHQVSHPLRRFVVTSPRCTPNRGNP